MRVPFGSILPIVVSAFASLCLAAPASAQERAGVVTTLEGNVTVARAALTEPAALKFRDDIFVSDRIAAGSNSIARILLGGRAVVTIREHSVVTITELPGTATVEVKSGRAAVAVARERMRPGDLIEVRTPNAVAGVRGTVVVAEVFDNRSVLTVLKGLVDVTRLDSGQPDGPTLPLGALQQMTIVGSGPVPAPKAISADDARHLGSQFRVAPPKTAPTAANAMLARVEMERTARKFSTLSSAAALGDSGRKLEFSKSDRDDKDRDSKGNTGTKMAMPVFNGVSPTLGWSTPSMLNSGNLTQARNKDKGKD